MKRCPIGVVPAGSTAVLKEGQAMLTTIAGAERSERSPYAVGCLTTLATTALTVVVTFGLGSVVVNRMVASRHLERSDFGTNGLNWYFAGMGLLDLAIAPLYFLVVYCAVLPLMYSSAKASRTRLLNAHVIVTGVLLPQLVLLGLLMLSPARDDRIMGLVMVVPLLALTMAATHRMVRLLNRQLREQRSSE